MFVNLQQIIEIMVKVEKLSEKQIEEKGIRNWPVWEKEESVFPWEYDSDEYCLIIEGEVVVSTSSEEFHIAKGDFVKFSKGLKCKWDIKKAVRKYYKFD